MNATLWEAVVTRDATATFIYAVTSTRIFCRPSCPSRRPRPERIRYFDTAAEAEAAGFRACLRCRPRSEDDSHAWVETAIARIDRALDQGEPLPTLEQLEAVVGLSRFHLQRAFKSAVGLTPKAFAEARRAQRLKTALGATKRVDAAGLEAGYGSSRALYEAGRTALGTTPAKFLRDGEDVRFTSVDSRLGPIFVARSGAGIRAVELGAEAAATLRTRWPKARRDDTDEELRGWVRRIVAALEEDAPVADLPLDIRATAFQWKVWRLLQATRPGETFTYEALAARLGLKAGARAVARACASNPVALVVPCHRVVRKDGGLGGYRWGLSRKAALLDKERR